MTVKHFCNIKLVKHCHHIETCVRVLFMFAFNECHKISLQRNYIITQNVI